MFTRIFGGRKWVDLIPSNGATIDQVVATAEKCGNPTRQVYEQTTPEPAEESVEALRNAASAYAYSELRTEDKSDYSDSELHEYDEDTYHSCVNSYIAGHADATATLQSQLKEAKAEVAALKEAQRWVPVSEKPATDRGQWIVLTKSGKVRTGMMFPDKSWIMQSSCDTDYVTHYQPLPQPPTPNQP